MNKWVYCYEKLYVVEKDLDTMFVLNKRYDVRNSHEISVKDMSAYSNLLKDLYASLKIGKDNEVDKIIDRINKLEKIIDSSYTKKNYSKKYVSKVDELMNEVDKLLNDDN